MELRARKIISKSSDVNLPSIENIMNKRLNLEVFKVLNNLSTEKFNGYFETIISKKRNKDILLRLPKAKLESFKKGFYFNGEKTSNELPRHVRAAKTINEFLDYFN